MTRPRGYLDQWNPYKKTRVLVDEIQEIMRQNAAYLPLSLRQIFYLGVSGFGRPKTEKQYGRLLDAAGNARRARWIDFDDIRDDGITQSRATVWRSRASFLATVRHLAGNFVLDPMQDQPRDLVVWIEGNGLVPIVRQFVDPWHVEVITSGGFDGLTIKHQMAQRFSAKPGIVLHLGDYDPSGEAIHRALREDLEAFGADVVFKRIAVTPRQIADLGLPTKPPKLAGNTHAESFAGSETVELEAIKPADLQAILQDAITDNLDMAAFERSRVQSEQVRDDLVNQIDQLGDAV